MVPVSALSGECVNWPRSTFARLRSRYKHDRTSHLSSWLHGSTHAVENLREYVCASFHRFVIGAFDVDNFCTVLYAKVCGLGGRGRWRRALTSRPHVAFRTDWRRPGAVRVDMSRSARSWRWWSWGLLCHCCPSEGGHEKDWKYIFSHLMDVLVSV